MPERAHWAPFVSPKRPIRVAFIGLGRIYDLNKLAYDDNDDVDVVALVDPNPARREQRQLDWPRARTFASIDELVASAIEIDTVEALVPIAEHEECVVRCLRAGWHVNLQKPIANDLASAERMIETARRAGRELRVMENYLFYEPLQRLKTIVDSNQLGEISGYHLKMVASGRGGWDVPGDTYERQFEQARRGRTTLLFDDGWHKLSTALWLFGPVREVRAWIGSTEIIPGITVDAPTSLVWEHTNGVRGVWDITLAVDMYLRSDYYTNDERWEVTGRRGFARVNRCTARGVQQPSLEVYLDGEMHAYHALDDDWASSFRDSGRHWLQWLRDGEGSLRWDVNEAMDVLRFALSAYESDVLGGLGVDPRTLGQRTGAAVYGDQ
ncbi:MAG TPA: Gfo/Idh/MocA family oxidoreductase [Acidimicrobiales bacterium]